MTRRLHTHLFGRLVRFLQRGRVDGAKDNEPEDGVVWRRGEPRLELESSNDEEQILVLRGESVFPVRNLSSRGIAYFGGAKGVAGTGEGAVIDAVAQFPGSAVPVTLQVRHRHAGRVGCQIRNPSRGWREQADALLKPWRLGQSLRQIDPRFVRGESDCGELLWFQAGPSCDLSASYDQGGTLRQVQLFFWDQFVEWTHERNLRTGCIKKQSPDEDGRRHAASDLCVTAPSPDAETLLMARRILRSASVPDEVKAPFGARRGLG